MSKKTKVHVFRVMVMSVFSVEQRHGRSLSEISEDCMPSKLSV